MKRNYKREIVCHLESEILNQLEIIADVNAIPITRPSPFGKKYWKDYKAFMERLREERREKEKENKSN